MEQLVMSEARNYMVNGNTWSFASYYSHFLDQYLMPCSKFFIGLIYRIYIRLTILNIVIFLIKYIPTTIYAYTLIKTFSTARRGRLRQLKIEMEDIELQIQIVNAKLSVREAEFSERQDHLRRVARHLRAVRARVREVIAADDSIRRPFESFSLGNSNDDLQMHFTTKEDRECTLESLKECDQLAVPERMSEGLECGESPQTKSNMDDAGVYSLLNDVDVRQDCRVKIVKVTNVYKVAYLKNYIKQKRLRRANKQMLLKKKMESVKKLLEDWQKALNMVINNKLSIINIEGYMDGTSQEAMGDYSKPHEVSDSDSDFRNSASDGYHDETNISWSQNPYRPYTFNYEELPEQVSRENDYDNSNMVYPSQFENVYHRCGNMVSIVEETNSQLAIIEQIKNDEDSNGCHEYIEI